MRDEPKDRHRRLQNSMIIGLLRFGSHAVFAWLRISRELDKVNYFHQNTIFYTTNLLQDQ